MSIELNVYRSINSLYDDATPEVLQDSQALDGVYSMVSVLDYILEGEPTFEYQGLHEIACRKVSLLKEMIGYISPEKEMD